MNEANKSVTLGIVEAKRLVHEYREVRDIVECQVCRFVAALDLAHAKPAEFTLAKLKEYSQQADKVVHSQLEEFERLLETTLRLPAEPGAPPNGGPAKPLDDSGVSGGPPSVS